MVARRIAPTVDNGILFLEDAGRAAIAAIERMLQANLGATVALWQNSETVICELANLWSGICDAYNGDYTFDTVIRTIQRKPQATHHTDFPGHVARRINFRSVCLLTLMTTWVGSYIATLARLLSSSDANPWQFGPN